MKAIELMILRRLIGDLAGTLLEQRVKLTIDSERGYDPDNKSFAPGDVDKAVTYADEFDEVHLFVGGNRNDGYGPFVSIIFGNGNCGLDLISDYSVSLEPVIGPIIDWLDQIDKGQVRLTTVVA